jgi:TRAP-type mannitol/chloroaromatic compound transport system permease small subunit
VRRIRAFLKVIDLISEWTGRICGWVILPLMMLVVIEVVLRYFFNHPTIWNFEITVQLYAFHFMIVAAFALLHGSHVAIDVFSQMLSKRAKAILDVITYTIFFFPFLIIVLYQGIKYSAKAWILLEKSWSSFQAPLYPIKTVIPLMAFLLLVQGIAIFIRSLYFAVKGEEI